MSLNLASIPINSANMYPNDPAILTEHSAIKYGDLKYQIQICALELAKRGVVKGDHVAIMLPNIPQFTITYFATLMLGAVVVPINVLLLKDEIAYHLSDSDSKIFITWEGFLEQSQLAFSMSNCELLMSYTALPNENILPKNCVNLTDSLSKYSEGDLGTDCNIYPTNPDDVAVILYTSGTTGRAKGAQLTHFNLYDNARYVSERLMRTKNDTLEMFSPGSIALAALPLFHSFGQTVIQNGFLFNGAAIALLPRFVPTNAAALIEKYKITFFAGVPTMYVALLNDPNVEKSSLSSLTHAVSGGSALPVSVLTQFKELFDIQILEGYGLSETSPIACFNSLMRTTKPGTVGPAIDLCKVKLIDAEGNTVANSEKGEIVIQGTNVMKGYYKKPEETKAVLQEGWFRTGDIGVMDDDGYVSIVDRKKEIIIRSGFNIYPREIEEILYKHAEIQEVAVIGIPDDIHGEEVVAVVVLKESSNLGHNEIETFCRQHLAAYKVPRKSKFITSMPKNATGKILKRTLYKEMRDENSKNKDLVHS